MEARSLPSDHSQVAAHRIGPRRAEGRILFLNENLGGHATLHLNLFRSLGARGDVEPVRIDVPRAGVARRALGVPVPGLARLDLDLAPLRSQLALSRVSRRLLRAAELAAPVDAIHAYSQHAVLGCDAVLRRHPTVVSTDGSAVQNAYQLPYRGSTRFTPRVAGLARWYERRVFDAATIVVAQSEWAAASIREQHSLDGEHLRVVPFGIVPPTVLPRRAPPGLPEITFVGASMDRKGGTQLVRVFRERLRDRCVLNLVTREQVRPEPGVRVLSDLRPGDLRLLQLLSRTTVFALPSEIDKSPYSVLEAMFAGVPVVSSRVGGIPEMVDDGVTGLLVEPGDDDALAGALLVLLDAPELAARMGAAGLLRARARFDARDTTAELLGVIADAQVMFRS